MKTTTSDSTATTATHTPGPQWGLEKAGLMWRIFRAPTAREIALYGISAEDARPMSILGVSQDDEALVADEEDARLIVCAVNSHAKLVAALSLACDTIERQAALHAPGWETQLVAAREGRAAIAKATTA